MEAHDQVGARGPRDNPGVLYLATVNYINTLVYSSINFIVWLTSPEAHFLKGKFVWTNWDVDELKENSQEIENSSLLTLGLEGASSFKY